MVITIRPKLIAAITFPELGTAELEYLGSFDLGQIGYSVLEIPDPSKGDEQASILSAISSLPASFFPQVVVSNLTHTVSCFQYADRIFFVACSV